MVPSIEELGSSRKAVYAGAGIAAVIAIAVAAMTGMQPGDMQQDNISLARNEPLASQAPISGQELDVASLIASGAPFKGDPDAQVAVIDFSDYQCTNCKRFATQTEPQIERDYVSTGDAVFIFKHFPIYGPNSVTAGMASMCAHDQGKFWEFHDHLYQNQRSTGSGWASADNMRGFASDLGIDRAQFDACLDGEKYRAYVEGDLALALSLGFPGTPSFVIMKNDGSERENVFGAQPYTSFKTVIDKKLT